jgi:4-amino-4-deoxy-L-arabinose transferase-like glycosyltransferase
MKKEKIISWSLFALLALLLIYTINLAGFLFQWDERFHALIALNLNDQLIPLTLYPDNVVSTFDYGPWYKTHLWLHKPPLFSYQMGFFTWLFGNAVWAVRLNSVLMLLLSFSFLARIVTKLGLGRINASLLAFVFCFSPMLLALTSGSLGMDHNDICFLGYVSGSFYFFIRYTENRKLSTAIWLGVFIGLAVLTKWLAGALGLCAFTLYALLKLDKKALLYAILALVVAFVIVFPWHYYMYTHYTAQYIHEFEYNAQHFSEVLEGHAHPWYFHLEKWLQKMPIAFLLLVIALLASFFQVSRKSSAFLRSIQVALIGGFAFFSIAATKLPAYTIIFLAPAYVLVAMMLNRFREKPMKVVSYGLFITSLVVGLNWISSKDFANQYPDDVARADYYYGLKEELPENAIIFNCEGFRFPEAMYYSDRIVYEFAPDEAQLKETRDKGYEPFIIVRDSASFDFERYGQEQLLAYYKKN